MLRQQQKLISLLLAIFYKYKRENNPDLNRPEFAMG
jgi:hypothetical protein